MINVEIWSDVVCPFCFIGKKHFEAALKAYDGSEKIEVIWRSFELDPTSEKSQKIKIYDLIAKKYGRSADWAKQNNERLTEQGKQIGIDFNFENIIPTNSFDAHRLLHLSREQDKQDEFSTRLFKSYFNEGKDIADHGVLNTIATNAGLSAERVKEVLLSDEFTEAVRAEEGEARNLQITGVPAFVFNRKFLVSGAQPVEVFVDALKEASKP